MFMLFLWRWMILSALSFHHLELLFTPKLDWKPYIPQYRHHIVGSLLISEIPYSWNHPGLVWGCLDALMSMFWPSSQQSFPNYVQMKWPFVHCSSAGLIARMKYRLCTCSLFFQQKYCEYHVGEGREGEGHVCRGLGVVFWRVTTKLSVQMTVCPNAKQTEQIFIYQWNVWEHRISKKLCSL